MNLDLTQFDLIAFDADDTLWVNEPHYQSVEKEFAELLSHHLSVEQISASLYETEKRNLKIFGYGAKGFMLSMIETAIELTEGEIKASELQKIIDMGKQMLAQPIELLDDVKMVLQRLEDFKPLMVLTKGDLFDQETKLARSGLARHFQHVEIVSEKNPETYAQILRRYNIAPERFLMIGNSLRSDILPMVAIGAQAIHIPYKTTWVHEQVSEAEASDSDYFTLRAMADLLEYIRKQFN